MCMSQFKGALNLFHHPLINSEYVKYDRRATVHRCRCRPLYLLRCVVGFAVAV